MAVQIKSLDSYQVVACCHLIKGHEVHEVPPDRGCTIFTNVTTTSHTSLHIPRLKVVLKSFPKRIEPN